MPFAAGLGKPRSVTSLTSSATSYLTFVAEPGDLARPTQSADCVCFLLRSFLIAAELFGNLLWSLLQPFYLIVVISDKGGCCAPWLHRVRALRPCGDLRVGVAPVLSRPWALSPAPVLSRPCAGAPHSAGPVQAMRSSTSLR